jgi:hypothetical protein
VGSPARDRRTPEQRVTGAAGERERELARERGKEWGEEKKGRKKKGNGRWVCRPVGPFKN